MILQTLIFEAEPNTNQPFSKIYEPEPNEHTVFCTNINRTEIFKYFIEPKQNLNKLKSLKENLYYSFWDLFNLINLITIKKLLLYKIKDK